MLKILKGFVFSFQMVSFLHLVLQLRKEKVAAFFNLIRVFCILIKFKLVMNVI